MNELHKVLILSTPLQASERHRKVIPFFYGRHRNQAVPLAVPSRPLMLTDGKKADLLLIHKATHKEMLKRDKQLVYTYLHQTQVSIVCQMQMQRSSPSCRLL